MTFTVPESALDALAPPDEPTLLCQLYNDFGNAERIIAVNRGRIRYCHEFKKFLIWNGIKWELDTTERAKHLAKLTMMRFLQEAIEMQNTGAEKFARASLNEKPINGALAMARPDLAIHASELDSDPALLNFMNGTVDLRTGILHKHDGQQFITKVVRHNYCLDAQSPVFRSFLGRIMGNDQSEGRAKKLGGLLQRAFGYSCTGHTSEKCAFIFHGGGNNGKTTLLELIRYFLDEYAVLLQIDSLMTRHESNNQQADLADLRGARFVMTSETERGQRLAEGRLKRITQGMGRIKAVRKYENPVEFPETHKLFLDANHKPKVTGTDNAIWNRLVLVPFEVTIPKAEQDRELLFKLKAEAEGILAWMVAGAVDWFKSGLDRPEEINNAVANWRAESEPLREFIEDRCVLNGQCGISALKKAYHAYCHENDIEPISASEFKERLKGLGCQEERITSGRFWTGIQLCEVTNDKK